MTSILIPNRIMLDFTLKDAMLSSLTEEMNSTLNTWGRIGDVHAIMRSWHVGGTEMG